MTYTSPLAESLAPDVLERFQRYVRVDTQSAREREGSPSTPGQLDLARMLVDELRAIGLGDAEERAADYIAEHVTKPVVAYIAGFTAPPGKTMGHAGAIISGSSGTAEGKKQALEAKGIRVGTSPTETAEIAAEIARA